MYQLRPPTTFSDYSVDKAVVTTLEYESIEK